MVQAKPVLSSRGSWVRCAQRILPSRTSVFSGVRRFAFDSQYVTGSSASGGNSAMSQRRAGCHQRRVGCAGWRDGTPQQAN